MKFEPAEPEVLQLLRSDQGGPLGILREVYEVPGNNRQSQILSLYYYAAEAQFCVLNAEWFTPERHFRDGDVVSAKLKHLQLFEAIFASRKSMGGLLLEYDKLKDAATLREIDTVLLRFFKTSGYLQVSGIVSESKVTAGDFAAIGEKLHLALTHGILSTLFQKRDLSAVSDIRLVLAAYTLSSAYVHLTGGSAYPDRMSDSFTQDLFEGLEKYPGMFRGKATIADSFPAQVERAAMKAMQKDSRGRPFPANLLSTELWPMSDLFAFAFQERAQMLVIHCATWRRKFPMTPAGENQAYIYSAACCTSEWMFGRRDNDPAKIAYIRPIVEGCVSAALESAVPVFSRKPA